MVIVKISFPLNILWMIWCNLIKICMCIDFNLTWVWIVKHQFLQVFNSHGPWLLSKFCFCSISCEWIDGIWLIFAYALTRTSLDHYTSVFVNLQQSYGPLLYPRHTKYVGVYSFRFSVCPLLVHMYILLFVFVRLFVFPSQGQSFCVKVFKTSYFEDPFMDFIHIWHDGRYRSKVFISTIPTPEVTMGSRSQNFHKKSQRFLCLSFK